ncbi:hypothetical protein DICPUDRAFT_78868 [Dictyostelium purpureum]|uniref:Uncharacterized protein n=1 Tax=Dictyostelium purpureum TaxID=5786 RepID=F0ZKU6_DICPU|nr:uncharacterized protein DICPUDRAFT_78868 [Dictyostelium purpureum]EGC35421.1 hypothetical protein DICPUDRAFT_78868 [Dictyostelium purpureum]|eukprot:XP_003288034.1 hypothetical protein DICPUDRAFT_78868 [Dictyostelium purpureum]
MNKKIIYGLYILTGIFIILCLIFSFSQVNDDNTLIEETTKKDWCESHPLKPIAIEFSVVGDHKSFSGGCSWSWYRSMVRITYLIVAIVCLNGLVFSGRKNKNLFFLCFIGALFFFGIFGFYSFIADAKVTKFSYESCTLSFKNPIKTSKGLVKYNCIYNKIYATIAFNALSAIMMIAISIISILNRNTLMNIKANNNNNNDNNKNSNSDSNANTNNSDSVNTQNKGFFKLEEEDGYPNYSLSSTASI